MLENKKKREKMKKVIISASILIIVLVGVVMFINGYVILNTKNKIITKNEAKNLSNVDCILILGAGIWGDKPSPMLEDRLLQGIELYKNGVAKKIIMSGDHGREDYDEVNVMKQFAIDRGIPSEDIFMDHAGFSTYESVKSKPTYLGETIPVSGNGDITNDKEGI